MVTDTEAVEIIEARLNKMGMCLKDKKSVEADIKAIRERKIKGTKEVTDKWEKTNMKYRKKPVVIDAVQFDGSKESALGISKILNIPDGVSFYNDNINVMEIRTLEGLHQASKGDWIIKGIKGEFYPCKPDIFEQTYEDANEG